MKSRSLAELCATALLLFACWGLLFAAWAAGASDREYSARAKPTEKCVPKHPFAAPDQPDCYRYLP